MMHAHSRQQARKQARTTPAMAQRKTLLIVDDDPLVREMLLEQFALLEEFEVLQAENAQQAIDTVQENLCDVVLLDVGLPDMDGREVCRLLRQNGFSGPVIMLTAMDSEADTILGLDSGANDYVTKPFRFSVLLARIRAHLRQYEHSEDAAWRLGPYVFKPAARVLLTEDGKKVRLTDKEVAILKFLHRAGNQPVERDILLREVWGYNSGVQTHTVETHIYRLRQKIEPDPANARILLTEPGGYRLNTQTQG